MTNKKKFLTKDQLRSKLLENQFVGDNDVLDYILLNWIPVWLLQVDFHKVRLCPPLTTKDFIDLYVGTDGV